MDNFLGVPTPVLHNSPSNSYIADEVASICPLITPSPPPNDLVNPPPETDIPKFDIGDELVCILKQVKDNKGADSASSSSSSALAEPACAQLLNRKTSTYHHIVKDEQRMVEDTNGKTQPMQLTFRNPPENYFFMSWNWPVIRKISLWIFLSGLIAMLALVIAMIYSLPKTCNPITQWYQGSVMYEIFPASFYASDNKMTGDLRGIAQKSDYIQSLGVGVVRLNSIFPSQNYPENYDNITSFLDIEDSLGTIEEFQFMVRHLHARNISLVLDLPLIPLIKQLTCGQVSNGTTTTDKVDEALAFWSYQNVDGFYLKGLENFAEDVNLPGCLRQWKRTIGPDRILIANEKLVNDVPSNALNTLLSKLDLIEVRLEIGKGVEAVGQQLITIQNNTLYNKASHPWIMWTLGDVQSPRLADVLPYGNGTLGATILQLMLPGTPSIFYGDEIGLRQIADPSGEREDISHLHQLTAMDWPNKSKTVLSWMHGDKAVSSFEQMPLVSRMIVLRKQSPAIYTNSVTRDGETKMNAEVKHSTSSLLVVQRWYPRRKSYVVVSNLGNTHISTDLSTLLYSGEVMIGPRVDSKPESVSFKAISLWPGESVVIVLD